MKLKKTIKRYSEFMSYPIFLYSSRNEKIEKHDSESSTSEEDHEIKTEEEEHEKKK